jgi:hypothetical protein
MTIRGYGYGDKHKWEDKGTEQSSMPSHRSTLWVCSECNEIFRHWYHQIHDIHEAMQLSNVKEECIKKELE